MFIVDKVISTIVTQAAKKVWENATQEEKILKVLDQVGLKPGAPELNFKSVYAHTLVEYGIGKHEPILEFFRHDDIQRAFRESFEKNDPNILHLEAESLIEWNRIGDALRKIKIDPRIEFARFTLVFNLMVDRTRTPAEVRRDHKIDSIDSGIQDLLEWSKNVGLQAIRAKNLEKIQGSLADQLKAWFKALGYEFGSHDVQTEEYGEWIIKISARRGFDRILVRCIEEQAECGHLENLSHAVSEFETDEGWLVASRRTSQAAQDMAEKKRTLFCYTFDELLDQHADFSRYFDWLKTAAKDRRVDTLYVPLACTREEVDPNTKEKVGKDRYDASNGWMEGYIDRWLEDPCKEHISILGEFGTGKTWFTLHYAYTAMNKYLEAKEKGLERPRVPLVIQLRDYSKALDCESLFSDFFFRRHEIPLLGYSAFEQLNRFGKLLLIFDGFDEMADKMDRQKMINHFWEIARIVVPGAKAILTCRTEHFPEAKEGRALLNAELKASTANLTGEPPQFEVLDLEKFDDDQIRKALALRTDPKTVDLILSHSQILDLARRPVLMEFILEALPEIERGKRVDLSRIYLYATRAKMERDIKSERTFTSMPDKLYFMCELSWEMLTTETMSLNYRLFPDRLKCLFGEIVSKEKDLDHWHYDMMRNTLLIRNHDGDYTPAHRSLLEFFVAFKATAELGVLPSDFTAFAQNQSNEDSALSAGDYPWNSYFRREKDQNGKVRLISPLRRFSPGNTDRVLDTLGRLGNSVLRFVHEITSVKEVSAVFHGLVAKVLDEFKDGMRDPEKEQGVLGFILKFKSLSQEWEEEANQNDSIRCFWKEYHEREMSAAKSGTEVETFFLKPPGGGQIKIEMAQVPTGSFLMGDEEAGPIHRVTITNPYYISKAPVTQALYQAVMNDNPSFFKEDHNPVESISWFDAARFCNTLSKAMNIVPAYKINGEKVEWVTCTSGFRLPTEVEWEYAARGGTIARFACGDLESGLGTLAWYYQNSGGKTHPVGQKEPNTYGLFDMHGNVYEWTWDWYVAYSRGSVNGPVGDSEHSDRVLRGGCWDCDAQDCRSANRINNSPDYRYYDFGFRLSRSLP
jgi:predicted NACHT family NTPase/formylglycine-generating enzyme required for sulfatase activity